MKNTKISLVCLALPALSTQKKVESTQSCLRTCELSWYPNELQGSGIDEKNGRNILVNFLAYEDQCSPANPSPPMVDHMQEIIEDFFYYGYKERPGRRNKYMG